MSKSTKCAIRSNRIRKVQNGGYTDIFQKEAEAEADRVESEARQNAIVNTTEAQNYLVAEAEREIRLHRSRIDDLKEQHYRWHDRSEFIDMLQTSYADLALAENYLRTIKMYAFNAPITTETSYRNYDWDKETYHEATSQYEDLRNEECPF